MFPSLVVRSCDSAVQRGRVNAHLRSTEHTRIPSLIGMETSGWEGHNLPPVLFGCPQPVRLQRSTCSALPSSFGRGASHVTTAEHEWEREARGRVQHKFAPALRRTCRFPSPPDETVTTEIDARCPRP